MSKLRFLTSYIRSHNIRQFDRLGEPRLNLFVPFTSRLDEAQQLLSPPISSTHSANIFPIVQGGVG